MPPSADGAAEKTKCTGYNVDEEESRGTIEFLDGGSELKEGHHIEADVNQAAVEEHRGDQAPPLIELNQKAQGETHTQADCRFAADAPKDAEAAALSGLHDHDESDAEHKEVGDEHYGSDCRIAADYSGELFAEGGKGEIQIG